MSVPVSPTSTADETRITPLSYRPALDGVRTLAVYLVLAFHAEIPQFAGGFLGVDIFFVLSGYLVTRVIFGGLVAGKFSLLSFYNRRIRRLLPAALVVLAAVTVAWYLVAPPLERLPVLADVRAATLYYSNWHFADQATDYFAAQNNPSPVLHFWSLSVEEQFYLFWPLLLLAVWRLGRRSGRSPHLVFGTAITLAALSLVALWLTLASGANELGYYGTHVRIYQLLGGAALAVGIHFWRWAAPDSRAAPFAPAIQIGALGALLVLSLSVIDADPAVRGVLTFVGTIALLWSLETRPSAPVSWAFSRPTMVYLGQISYGTYLWHYPVTVLIRRYTEMHPVLVFVAAAVVASALAALSQHLLELPIRQAKWLHRRSAGVIATGLVASLLAGLLIFPQALTSPTAQRIRPAVEAVAGTLPDSERIAVAGIDLVAASTITPGSVAAGPQTKDRACTGGDLNACLVVRNSGGKKILLMGDSHALALLPSFRAIAVRNNMSLTLAATLGCPWQYDLQFPSNKDCQRFKAEIWYPKVVEQLQPDLLVVVSRATDHTIGGDYGFVSTNPAISGTPSQILLGTTDAALSRLEKFAGRIAVVEPVPVSKLHAMECLSGARFVDECSFVAAAPSEAEQGFRQLQKEHPHAQSIDLDPLVCPRLPVCDAVTSGVVVRKDHDHLTERMAAMLADPIEALLRSKKLL